MRTSHAAAQVGHRASGRHIHLLGEGWNFGEIANGARFVQASQLSLNGSGIGAFSDRGRDAARGGGCCDNAAQSQARQGLLNGLFYDPNGHANAQDKASAADQLRAAEMVRVGLAGTPRSSPHPLTSPSRATRLWTCCASGKAACCSGCAVPTRSPHA